MASAKNTVKNDAEKKKEKPEGKTTAARKSRFVFYLLLIVLAGIVGLVIASVKYFGSEKVQRSASISIEFTYDGAAQNLTPSKEQFSIDDIFNDTVLEQALERAGMTGRYTAESIRKSMVVDGSYPGDVISKIKEYDSLYNFSESRVVSISDYYPTIYTVKLYDDFDTSVSESDMNSLVQAIADEYKEYFTTKFVYSFDLKSLDELMVLDRYDYAQRVKILKFRLQLIENYSDELYNLDTNFRRDGKSKAEASIMMDVLTTSSERLRNQYEYEKKLLENEKIYKTENLDELNKLIESYQVDSILYIPSGDSLVKVDSNSKETYETLVDKKREISDRIGEIESEIARFDTYLQDLNKASLSYSSIKKNKEIGTELDAINEQVAEQESIFRNMASAYNNSIIDEDSVLIENSSYSDAKLLSFGFVAAVIKCAAPICILVMICCCIHSAVIESKKYKKELEKKEA